MKKWWKESALRQLENGMEAIEGLLVITLMLFLCCSISGRLVFDVPELGCAICRNWIQHPVLRRRMVLEFGPDYWLYQS